MAGKQKLFLYKICFILFLFFSRHCFSQQEVPYCDFKGITEKMGKVDPKNTIEELDKLFGTKAKIVEKKARLNDSVGQGKGDSLYINYKYQFCDSNIKNCIFVSFYGGKMRYVMKGFKTGKCYGGKNTCTFAMKKGWTYEETKSAYGVEGDLWGIFWNAEGKETQREYQWYCCESKEYSLVIFEEGKFVRSSHFPKIQNGWDLKGNPLSHPSGRR
jgi:hypothetical protein